MPRPAEEEERVPTGICQPRIGQLSIIVGRIDWERGRGGGSRKKDGGGGIGRKGEEGG